MARLSWPIGWLHNEINVQHRELNPDTVTRPSTNRARRRLTSLIETSQTTANTVFEVELLFCLIMSFVKLGADGAMCIVCYCVVVKAAATQC